MQYISKIKIDERLVRQVICHIDQSMAVLDKTNRAYNHVRLYLLKNHKEQVLKLINMMSVLDKGLDVDLERNRYTYEYYRPLIDQYNKTTKELAGLVLKNIGEYVNG